MKLALGEIMAAVQAEADIRPFAGAVCDLVTSDSRQARPGALFCCLKGERADGHDFAAQAVERGAGALLASRPLPEVEGRATVLQVPDVLVAMGLLARHWRRRTRAVVAALSGSAGKTTAKEMLASIAARMAASIKNPGNFNNQLGLPLSMLAAEEEHRLWVLELGISRPGDMEELGAICEPDVAVVHNIGPAHLEGLGSIEGVGRAKAALFHFLRPGGVALANRDYPELWAAAREIRPDVQAMSTRDREAPYYCSFTGCGPDGRGLYRLNLQGLKLEVALSCHGGHLAENVLAAAAAASVLGADARQIAEGLAAAELPGRRFDVSRMGGLAVIDDTYNANPLSMAAAIESARALAGGGPLVLVLGEMGELGPEADQAHQALGECIARGGCDLLVFKGGAAGHVERGLRSAGYTGRFVPVETAEEFEGVARDMDIDEGAVLFKGSRSQRMEEFLERFLATRAGESK
ncbi:UDP-N-acetylmuramoyl-tripeptide--D-alanyl-D-alanine ligase [Fundidesulfovibrio agrisoli]|uniref:UDP-N-acetylmuramoyl-tripeptide--D-alanyl-D- alanine ligase n=1 Tax=Fundidesulfovibrio agrisoli TaxID=2922717 RepID=UPI001FAE546B|nr:UDP-N-acetylmuramoyl-tripeptide--D-alanyl-D-alanine ligase [Fundidesulfovibrio agrisoli]